MSKARNLADLGDDFDGTDMVVSGELESQSLKINGTTVIDSSRNLSNVGGLKTINSTSIVGSGDIGFKTVNGTSVVGSGDISAGASTTYAAVGTYTAAGIRSGSNRPPNQTVSGSSLIIHSDNRGAFIGLNNTKEYNVGLSGTWRQMAWQQGTYNSPFYYFSTTLWVRIA